MRILSSPFNLIKEYRIIEYTICIALSLSIFPTMTCPRMTSHDTPPWYLTLLYRHLGCSVLWRDSDNCVVHLLDEGVSSREDASTSWPSSSGLRGHRKTILESADNALFKMVRFVLLWLLGPGLDGQDVEASSREDTPSSGRWTGHMFISNIETDPLCCYYTCQYSRHEFVSRTAAVDIACHQPACPQ
jgi:hypothetical protein